MITVISGPPCAGKSTFLKEHAKPGDTVVDLDEISAAFGSPDTITPVARVAREAAISEILTATDRDAWIIHTNPKPEQIEKYRDAGATFELVDPGIDVALERAADRPDGTAEAIRKWYAAPPQISDPGGRENPQPDPGGQPMPEPKEEEAQEATEFTADDKASFEAELKKKNSEAKGLRDRLVAAEKALKEINDKDKSDEDKSSERLTELEKANSDLVRENVALAAGLTVAQAKRLSGATREELETDAAEYAAELKGTTEPKEPVPGKPRENIPRGGGDPEIEVEETDPAKLAAAVPRSNW